MKQLRRVIENVPGNWVGDGFPVRSLFSYADDAAEFSPFLLLDYAEPYDFPPSTKRRGVGAHPHRGFETVTIVYQGELEHRDSAGNHGVIGPGDVQWMRAASGVVHEEFHSESFTRSGGLFEVAQLWVNLPAAEKMFPPRYQEIRDRDLPRVTLENNAGTVRVIAGTFLGATGPARTVTPMQIANLQLEPGHVVTLPVLDGDTTLLVLQRGEAIINESRQINSVSVAVFDRAGDGVEIESKTATRALLLAGQPIDEPVYGQGPFVMNTREEIHQAIRDYQSGRMGHFLPSGVPPQRANDGSGRGQSRP